MLMGWKVRAAFLVLVVGTLLTFDAFGLSIPLAKTQIGAPLQAGVMVRVIPEIVDLGSGGVIWEYFNIRARGRHPPLPFFGACALS